MSSLFRTDLKLLVLIGILIFSSSSFASAVAIKGYMVDVACSARRARKPEPPTVHSRLCMQMPSCNDSGYGILTQEKQFIKFDDDGNQKARKLLAETNQANDFKITVLGSMDGDKMKVSKIELQ